ncbi:hypothetical protein IKP85_06785 [bacterium]|nr:hypothetical protein [bacterium]
MKKILILILLLFVTTPVFAAQWLELFEKKYIDIESIDVNENYKIVKFWTKNLRKDPKEKFPNYMGKMTDYWYSMNRWNIDCINQKSRIETYTVYDLKQNIIYSDNNVDWNPIIPETYADGYYRVFCMVDFKENPLINPTQP